MVNYRKVGVIHTSASGKSFVWKVVDRNKPDKFYAMKFFAGVNDDFQKLVFKRELEALQMLRSCEGIVKIHDNNASIRIGDERNYGTILMDYIPGDTLDKIDWSRYSLLKKYEICLKILKAVKGAHANDVIHRDLKPSNIIYDEIKDEITIIDFGFSKIKTIIEKETTMPRYSENYSAPEVILGYDITEASDIYSLGAIFYEIFFLKPATSENKMVADIQESSNRESFKNILIGMLATNSDERVNNVVDVISVFSELIGELNVNRWEYNIFVGVNCLELLKRKYVIPKDMTMALFTNSYLKKQFSECYGYFDSFKKTYFITGLEIVAECTFNTETKVIDIIKINEIAVDRRNINIKRGFKIEGKIDFIDSRFKYSTRVGKDNAKLLVMFVNKQSEKDQYKVREEKFDKLFGEWEKGLNESVESEKEKVGKITYENYKLDNGYLIIDVSECINKSIDEIQPNTKYIIEGKDNRNQPIYLEVGTFEEAVCEDDAAKVIIKLPNKFLKANVKALLKKKIIISEDFRANIKAYRRQFSAINALKADDCSAKNLKDIILNIEEPESTPNIVGLHYSTKDLNDSQKLAVMKSLHSENISLIQGPPGTGKTKVIKEIIFQIIKKSKDRAEIPRILIVSQSHTAVDNILEGLPEMIDDSMQVVRIGQDKDISSAIASKYTIEAHRNNVFEKIEEKAKKYCEEQELIYSQIESKDEKDKWERIKAIQKDWIKRIGERDCLDYQVVRSASVIAGTCIGFLSNEHIKEMEFDYVIIDEAAKATTPELLVSIIRAKKIILVGDQNQLPAFSDERISPTIAKLTKNPQFRLFDVLFESLPETHKQVLTTQYRMISNIGNLISHVFYGDTIETGIDDNLRQHGLSRYKGKSIVWFNTSGNARRYQKKVKGGSFINEEEKRIIQIILQDLNTSGELEGKDIGIITGYSAQKDLIKKAIKARQFDDIANININTLDAFQGRENDIIIYSTVRTNNSIGFQKEKERVNVAFSRARKLFIICGDMDFFYTYDDPNNKFIEIIDYINEHEQCQVISCKGEKIF